MSQDKIPATKAPCFYCGKSYSKGGFTRHIKSCKDRKAAHEQETGKQTIYHLRVEDAYGPYHWLNIEIAGNQTLARLDQFLRDIWLECCGHLSNFEINGIEYMRRPMPEYGDKSMSKSIQTVLSANTVFRHVYDFGTSTELMLKVVEMRKGTLPTKPDDDVRILARNEPPAFMCGNCEERPATQICQECIWDNDFALWCDACIDQESHEHDEYMRVSVVNSPRMGECGFDGARLT